MMIKKISPITEILPGQWICMEPMMRDHICTTPREVIRRSGKRVYFKNRHGEDEGRYCAISSIVALCDTQEEGEQVYAISKEQFDTLNSTRENCARRVRFLFETSQSEVK